LVESVTGDSRGSGEIPVGAALAELRRAAGITGQELGRRTGMSQAKVSKIETGAMLADPRDVARLAEALSAPADVVRGLVQQAERAHNHMTDWRLIPVRPSDMQHDYADFETASRVTRSFSQALLPGLVQTSEYARAILTLVQPQWTEDGHAGSAELVARAVSDRIRRQAVLADPHRQFHFLVSETVLQNQLCRPEDMPAQLERLREVAKQKNVTVRIITTPPFHGFEIFDDRGIAVELFNTVVMTRGKSDVRIYRKIFADFEQQATADIDPILDRYIDSYLDLARSRRGR
jgi:transcriptional regulator with XRE-family HTH domain